MLTSARIRSGFEALAACSAAFPSSTVVSFTSSRANVIETACWMVLESSARSRFLGMTRAASGESHNYKVAPIEASFARALRARPQTSGVRLQAKKKGAPDPWIPAPRGFFRSCLKPEV